MSKDLFRAWDTKAEVMVYDVVVYPPGDHIGFGIESFEAAYKDKDTSHLEYGDDWHWLFEFKSMQCTGLTDKNGRLVYAGDIIKFVTQDGNNWIRIVNWHLPESRFAVFGFLDNYKSKSAFIMDIIAVKKAEVIGHLYKDLELLILLGKSDVPQTASDTAGAGAMKEET